MRDILFVAGEASGDLHAGAVAEALRRTLPGAALMGIGGDRMRAAGVTLIEHVEQLAVMGLVEVLRHVPRHWTLLRALRRRLRSGKVGLVILVDYPGFNMKVATAAADAGVPVLYYITPQVWAWGEGRLEAMASVVSRAAVILPFEEALLRRHGIDAEFVGHPLLDRARDLPDRSAARAQLGVVSDAPLLALFPGSRAQEIERLFDDFVAAAQLLRARVPTLQVVVAGAPTVRLDPARCPFPVVQSASFTILRAADAALCKSGTTTLEAAVAGCPLVVGYRTSRWTYAIARRLVRIPRIALVNVVAGEEVAPELIQEAATPAAFADALEPLLDCRSERRQRMLAGLASVRESLGTPGAASRVAAIAAELHR